MQELQAHLSVDLGVVDQARLNHELMPPVGAQRVGTRAGELERFYDDLGGMRGCGLVSAIRAEDERRGFLNNQTVVLSWPEMQNLARALL